MMLRVHAARFVANVISIAVNGAYKISTILPCIFPIIIDDDECENDCWITCMAISPGARKLINENPKTSPLSFPIASERTIKNNSEVISGETIVWIPTIRNLSTSFL